MDIHASELLQRHSLTALHYPNLRVIAIEGLIAAGKTTLLACLNAEFNRLGYACYVVEEPVDHWKEVGILKSFYENQKRYSYDFQTFAFSTRITKNLETYDKITKDYPSTLRNPSEQKIIIFMERSPFTDSLFMEMLFENEKVSQMHMSMYRTWQKHWSNLLPYAIDGFIFLDPDLSTCMKRLEIRNRKGEKGKVSSEYQEKLRQIHEEFFRGALLKNTDTSIGDIPHIRISTNGDFRTPDSSDFKSIFNRVRNFAFEC